MNVTLYQTLDDIAIHMCGLRYNRIVADGQLMLRILSVCNLFIAKKEHLSLISGKPTLKPA